jgi:hypothetical protein
MKAKDFLTKMVGATVTEILIDEDEDEYLCIKTDRGDFWFEPDGERLLRVVILSRTEETNT